MEIIFNNVSYSENLKTVYEKKYLKSVSFKINENEITAIISDDDCKIGELLTAAKKPTGGYVSYGDFLNKKGSNIDNINELRKQIAWINCSFKKIFLCNTVKEEIALAIRNYMKGCKDINKRVSDSLKLVGLDDSFVDKNPNNLSYIEQKKIIFATFISYNPKIIIIDGYEQGMTFKERDSLKKMLRLLKVRYNKTIIIISNDINFIMDIVDSYVVINRGVNVLEGTKNDFYKEELYQYVEKPKIIEFIKYAKEKGHDIENYVDIKELIKGIYRDVT